MATVEIIAECAQGFEGKPELAHMLATGAVKANADWLKFQLVYADELCVPSYPYFDFFKSLEMSDETWTEIIKFTHSNGRKFIFDVFGEQSLSKAEEFGADAVKISTTDFFNDNLIRASLESFPTVFLSIGGIKLVDILEKRKSLDSFDKLVLMYGYQNEPTSLNENNLARVPKLKQIFENMSFGFMDHTEGTSEFAFDIAKIALGCGVEFIEKHITVSNTLELEDHISALGIDQFKSFTKEIKVLSNAMGLDDLTLSGSEENYSAKASKVIVSKRSMKAGEIICTSDVTLKRVSVVPDPLCIQELSAVSGLRLLTNKNINEPIKSNEIE